MIVEIVFAAGCFWGVEKHFENLDGVIDVKSVYVGGSYPNPNYKTVLKYRNTSKNNFTNYTEGVVVKFDNSKISTKTLIKDFWELHDPTQLNGQGNDIGNNYRSGIYYTNDKQLKIANETKTKYQKILTTNGYSKIVTEIKPLGKYYLAENKHQDYLERNPYGYCPNHSTGVKFPIEHIKNTDVNTEVSMDVENGVESSIITTKNKQLIPIKGKEIIVVESENYCPYCVKFKKDVLKGYKGNIKLTVTFASKLKNYSLKGKIQASPTILFIEDGKETVSYLGYMNSKEFYKELGKFKLGENSEGFNVAFNKGTDGKFCKKYKIFKNTPDGVFVDKLSGEVLFDTKDRFNSGTGWLSFKKFVGTSVVEKEDRSYGMVRTEIIAKESGVHLGHVFDEHGYRRFCINATVLEFKPRK